MSPSRSRFVTCQNRKIHLMEWGNPQREKVVIWHGVTGTCHDHEILAASLAQQYHVICPDAIGCGLSDWVKDARRDPSLNFAADIAREMMRQLEATSVRWIGSSKGGSLGMILAAEMQECPVTHLVLNDVGPTLPERFRQAVKTKLAKPPQFDDFLAFENHLREFLSKTGLSLREQQWRRLAMHWSRRKDNGTFTFHNDPAIANQFSDHPEDFDLWHHFQRINCKTLLIKGQHSIVSAEDAERMQRDGSDCTLYKRQGGHVTLLDSAEEQSVIIDFLHH